MVWKLTISFVFILCMKYCLCIGSRRISLGKRAERDTRYLVYLLKSEKSSLRYPDWLCAGAIVSPTYILTSASCIRDVGFLYAIAGYRKYVRSENLNLDKCTRERKQKVIRTCYPKKNTFTHQILTEWLYLDIGFAIVEKPYNFTDLTYRFYCSYVPAPIKINLDPKYVVNGTNAMVYGWGHQILNRQPGNTQDFNQEYLHSVRTRIVPKTVCNSAYTSPNLTNIIMENMICCQGDGLLDENGNPDYIDPVLADGRSRRKNTENFTDDFIKSANDKNIYNETNKFFYTRKQGICQNDHGAPLVTWIGKEEYVLGVASTSLIKKNSHCSPPYLYTSAQCTSRFIKCALLGYGGKPVRRMCDNLEKEEGYAIHETKIDWAQMDGNEEINTNLPRYKTKLDDDGSEIFKFNPDDWDNETDINDFFKQDARTGEDSKDEFSSSSKPGLAYKLNFDSVTDDVIII